MNIPELSEFEQPNASPIKKGFPSKPQSDTCRREIGDEGIWSLSSCKIGNGIEQLREDNLSTFWQSDDV